MNQWRTWTVTLMCVFLLGGSPAYAEEPEAAGEETVPAQEAQDGIQERGVPMNCTDGPEGRICSIQQELRQGVLVPVQRQKDLGLVTVGGGCSGTLLNRFWVLTADHCVTSNSFVPTRNVNGPAQALNMLPITAAWSTRRVIPTRLVRQVVNGTSPLNVAGSGGLDVALIYLGLGDFGPVNTQILHQDDVEDGMTLTKYGRGIFEYARAGPPPVPADPGGGLYRSARFVASNAGSLSYRLAVNDAGQVGQGGDSGGPDIVTAPNGVGLGIAGVQSTCSASGRVPGMGPGWTWVTGINFCNSAAISTVRYEIIQIIQEKPSVYKDTIISPSNPPLFINPSPPAPPAAEAPIMAPIIDYILTP